MELQNHKISNGMKIFRKLVRDNVPEIIKMEGKNPITHVLEGKEYVTALENKLLEEVQELRSAKEDPEEEIADVYEVLDALIEARGFNKAGISAIKEKKRRERGGFSKKLFLDSVE